MLGHANTEMVIRHYHKFIPNLTRQDGSALSRQIDQARVMPGGGTRLPLPTSRGLRHL
jgi:hypothetical protein